MWVSVFLFFCFIELYIGDVTFFFRTRGCEKIAPSGVMSWSRSACLRSGRVSCLERLRGHGSSMRKIGARSSQVHGRAQDAGGLEILEHWRKCQSPELDLAR